MNSEELLQILKFKPNVQKTLLKREMADVLLLEQCHGLLVTVIKESPKSSEAQQILFTQSRRLGGPLGPGF